MYLFVDPHVLLTTGLQFASGLVVRSANPADKRTRHVRLTEEGQKVVESLRGGMARAQERLLEPLRPAERTMLMDLMRILVEANNQYSRTVLRTF